MAKFPESRRGEEDEVIGKGKGETGGEINEKTKRSSRRNLPALNYFVISIIPSKNERISKGKDITTHPEIDSVPGSPKVQNSCKLDLFHMTYRVL